MFKKLFGPNMEEVRETLKKHFQQNYMEAISIDRLEKRDKNFWAKCSLVLSKNEQFEVYINKKLEIIKDGYMNCIMSKKLDEYLIDHLQNIFDTKISIKSEIDFGQMKTHDEKMDILSYLKKDDELFVTLNIFVETHDEVDTQKEAKKAVEIYEYLHSLPINFGEIETYYMKSVAFGSAKGEWEKALIGEDYISSEELFDDGKKSYTHYFISYMHGKLEYELEEIVEQMEENIENKC